jgi:hypothetical protein
LEKLRIIVGGYIGLYPTGGAVWDYIQYPLGLSLIGHDVYYIEDTMQYPVFQTNGKEWNDASGCVEFLESTMKTFGLEGRWAYRDVASGQCYGLPINKVLELCRTADLFINISCSTFMREEYLSIPNRILIDSDPMFTQIQYFNELKEQKSTSTKQMVESHNYLFSFGENIGSVDCKIPLFGFKWISTHQPICFDLWQYTGMTRNASFTSIMNWSGRERLIYDHQEWGQKDIEFEKFKTLPGRLPDINFEMVINKPLNKESHYDSEALEDLGWKILDPQTAVSNLKDYRDFILNSTGEFSIAKQTYVNSKSGWFSCRSACYLAAGKPVVTQETGWSKYIPSGHGLFSFTNMETAVDAIQRIQSDREYHSKKAKGNSARIF